MVVTSSVQCSCTATATGTALPCLWRISWLLWRHCNVCSDLWSTSRMHFTLLNRSKRKGKKGRVHVAYGFNARGPAQRVHPQWVPQLQMHMLATGCQSALLVSRCVDGPLPRTWSSHPSCCVSCMSHGLHNLPGSFKICTTRRAAVSTIKYCRVGLSAVLLCCSCCCCRCAHSGVRVFRLWRDDAYLQTMLQLLSVLQTQHVLQGVQPSAATYKGLPGYQAFLHRTATLARSAECIVAAGEEVTSRVPAAPDGYNLERFWQ